MLLMGCVQAWQPRAAASARAVGALFVCPACLVSATSCCRGWKPGICIHRCLQHSASRRCPVSTRPASRFGSCGRGYPPAPGHKRDCCAVSRLLWTSARCSHPATASAAGSYAAQSSREGGTPTGARGPAGAFQHSPGSACHGTFFVGCPLEMWSTNKRFIFCFYSVSFVGRAHELRNARTAFCRGDATERSRHTRPRGSKGAQAGARGSKMRAILRHIQRIYFRRHLHTDSRATSVAVRRDHA
jgi:hypothetical protein